MNLAIKNPILINTLYIVFCACNSTSFQDEITSDAVISSGVVSTSSFSTSSTTYDHNTTSSTTFMTSSTMSSSDSGANTTTDINTSIADTTKPICGNGIVDNNEECDNGDLNGDGSYNGCTEYCALGSRCGDGILQKDFEECDDGTVLEDDICVECTIKEYRLVFVTAQEYTSQFTDTALADAHCTISAFQAGLSGTKWIAWLSANNDDVESRINHFDGWFVLPTNPPLLLFKGWEGLKLGKLQNPISVTEYGYKLMDPSDRVWTSTTITGYLFDNGDICDNWNSSSNERSVIIGSPFEIDFRWSANYEVTCDQKLHLYCFENK